MQQLYEWALVSKLVLHSLVPVLQCSHLGVFKGSISVVHNITIETNKMFSFFFLFRALPFCACVGPYRFRFAPSYAVLWLAYYLMLYCCILKAHDWVCFRNASVVLLLFISRCYIVARCYICTCVYAILDRSAI